MYKLAHTSECVLRYMCACLYVVLLATQILSAHICVCACVCMLAMFAVSVIVVLDNLSCLAP